MSTRPDVLRRRLERLLSFLFISPVFVNIITMFHARRADTLTDAYILRHVAHACTEQDLGFADVWIPVYLPVDRFSS